MLFTKALENYKEYLKGIDRSKRTIEGYFIDLNFFNRWLQQEYNGPVYLEDITLEDIEEFLKMLKDERNYKPSSRRRQSAAIKMFYKFAYKKKLVKEDIASQIESVKVVTKERDYLTEEEVLEFISKVNHPLAEVVIYMMFYAGLRVSECTNLKVEDVDLEKKLIKVIAGKGNKNRTVPIGQKLQDILEDYITWRVDSEHFFASEQSRKISRITLAAIVRDTRRAMKLEKKVTPHTFRHSFASHLVKNNANIVSVSKLMGHSDIKVTSVYTHAGLDMLEDAIGLM